MTERISDERLAKMIEWYAGSDEGDPEALAALRELQALRREREWQPIETAPDDVAVLGWGAEYGARQTIHWLYPKGSIAHAQDPTARFWDWAEPQNHWSSSWNPTHWLPLPIPPKDHQP